MEESKELKVITKAMEMVQHGYILTSNSNRYPKKYRFSLVDRIQLKSMDIYENLMEANRMKEHEKRERHKLQTKAITCCDQLLFYIELSKGLDLLSWKSAEYWSGLVKDIKYMSIAWRTSSNKN